MSLLQNLGYYGPGNWSIGNFRMPELGLTEKFGGGSDTSLSDATRRRILGEGVAGPVMPSTQDFGVTEDMDRILGTNVSGGGVVGAPMQQTQPAGGGGGGSWEAPERSGYDSRAMLESVGLDKSQKSEAFKKYGVDNTPDLLRAMADEQEAQNRMMREIESAYGAKMGYFGGLEKSLGKQRAQEEANLRSLIGEEQRVLGQQKASGIGQVELQEKEGGARRADALADASRIYNELLRGGQQRYGGASSAGEAYKAIGGQQLQRNRAGIMQQYNQFMQQAAFARQDIQRKYSIALQNLQSQKTRAMSQIRMAFDSKLSEINAMKAEAESDKANMRLSALQDLRNQAFQLQLVSAQQEQQLQSEMSQVTQALDAQTQEQAKALSESIANVPNEVGLGGALLQEMPALYGGMPQTSYVGQIAPGRDEEDIFGR